MFRAFIAVGMDGSDYEFNAGVEVRAKRGRRDDEDG
jgi:hypothetical protein